MDLHDWPALADHLIGTYLYRYAWTGNWKLEYISAGVYEIHGVTAETAMQDPTLLRGQIDPSQRQDWDNAKSASLVDLADFDMDVRIQSADGRWRWIRDRARFSKTPEGVIVTDGVVTDVQILQLKKMDALRDLAGTVAHDLNNMLTIIRGYTELILLRLPADSHSLRGLNEIQTAAIRASGITRHLRSFSRLQPLESDSGTIGLVTDTEAMIRRLIHEDDVNKPGM